MLRVTDRETDTTSLYHSVKEFAVAIGLTNTTKIGLQHFQKWIGRDWYRNRYWIELIG